MAALPVEIRGTLYDLQSRTARQVYIVGEAARTDVGIGGGPVYPPGSGGTPSHPIVLPGDPSWGDPHPAHPIELPKPPTEPPPDGGDKPPPQNGGWGFVAEWSQWGYFPGPGQAQPKS